MNQNQSRDDESKIAPIAPITTNEHDDDFALVEDSTSSVLDDLTQGVEAFHYESESDSARDDQNISNTRPVFEYEVFALPPPLMRQNGMYVQVEHDAPNEHAYFIGNNGEEAIHVVDRSRYAQSESEVAAPLLSLMREFNA